MISVHLLLMFIAALVVVYALPGPDMAFVLQTSIGSGVRRGLAAAAGFGTARALHVTLSACGVAALLRDAPWLYDVVRWGGAVYLGWIAIQIFRSPVFAPPTAEAGAARRSLRGTYVRGMMTTLSNPKALLFCSVLLPQFVRPQSGSVGWQMVELGVVLVVVGALFDGLFVFGASRLSSWLRQHPLAQVLQRWTFAAVLLGFAVRLSLD